MLRLNKNWAKQVPVLPLDTNPSERSRVLNLHHFRAALIFNIVSNRECLTTTRSCRGSLGARSFQFVFMLQLSHRH
jgi:hypothetical protein